MKEKTKNALIIVLIVGLVSMTIAYAALTQVLRVNASAKVIGKDSNWNVHFTNPVGPTTTGYAEVEEGSELVISGTTTLENLVVTLKAPGDSVSYEFKVKNDGAIDAKIDTVFLPDIQTANYNGASAADEALVKANLYYTLKYKDNNTTPASDDLLAKNTERTLVLTIGYDSNATDMPSNTVTVSGLNSHIDYKQN